MQNEADRHSSKAMRRVRREDGFTLVELLVVVLIIGILITIGLPTYLGARERASNRANQEDLRTALAAAMTFWAEAGDYTGYNVAEAENSEPALDWVPAGAPLEGEIAIQVAAGQQLLLIGLSRTGTYSCVAQQAGNPVTSTGKSANFADVDTVAECTGGWG